jgi:hypothetical protein
MKFFQLLNFINWFQCKLNMISPYFPSQHVSINWFYCDHKWTSSEFRKQATTKLNSIVCFFHSPYEQLDKLSNLTQLGWLCFCHHRAWIYEQCNWGSSGNTRANRMAVTDDIFRCTTTLACIFAASMTH